MKLSHTICDWRGPDPRFSHSTSPTIDGSLDWIHSMLHWDQNCSVVSTEEIKAVGEAREEAVKGSARAKHLPVIPSAMTGH